MDPLVPCVKMAGEDQPILLVRVHGEAVKISGKFEVNLSPLETHAKGENNINQLILEVVPASGTGELAGLAGEMSIKIEDGQHLYEFEYGLPN